MATRRRSPTICRAPSSAPGPAEDTRPAAAAPGPSEGPSVTQMAFTVPALAFVVLTFGIFIF